MSQFLGLAINELRGVGRSCHPYEQIASVRDRSDSGNLLGGQTIHIHKCVL